jgi:orotidine-5'-phosphate decarboxylase
MDQLLVALDVETTSEGHTLADALRAGASYLVVGPPIISAPDPCVAAERIVGECRGARTS